MPVDVQKKGIKTKYHFQGYRQQTNLLSFVDYHQRRL